MENNTSLIPLERIGSAIRLVRGQKVLLDNDLARLYGAETRVLNQAVSRNAGRFPEDFMFQLLPDEAETWRRSRSQFVILKRGENLKYRPYAFTEQDVAMLSSVLHSDHAVRVNIENHARLRPIVADVGLQRGPGPETGGAGEEIRLTVQSCL
ncbi:MAG: ORF6N domain-containing protein [Limisphaerales bacterium]